MLKKFFSVIALIYFLLIGTMSASASEWCPIFDYSVNYLIDDIKKVAYEKNFSIYNIKQYTENGISYVTANFDDNSKNVIKFQLNKNGGVQWFSVKNDFSDITNFNESPTKSMNEMREKISSGMYLFFLGYWPNMALNDNESKIFNDKLVNKMDTSIDSMFKKLKSGQKVDDIIDISENIWSSGNNRYYHIRLYWDYEKNFLNMSVQAYK